MNFKSYPNSTNTKSRKTRKGMRYTVFTFNRKAKQLQRKAERLARKEQNA